MKPGHYDLPTIWRGADYPPITFTWLDAAGNPIVLFGWRPEARTRNFDLHPVVTNYGLGTTQITLPKAETEVLALGVESWDWIWIHIVDGVTTPPLIAGFVEIKEPTTEPD